MEAIPKQILTQKNVIKCTLDVHTWAGTPNSNSAAGRDAQRAINDGAAVGIRA